MLVIANISLHVCSSPAIHKRSKTSRLQKNAIIATLSHEVRRMQGWRAIATQGARVKGPDQAVTPETAASTKTAKATQRAWVKDPTMQLPSIVRQHDHTRKCHAPSIQRRHATACRKCP